MMADWEAGDDALCIKEGPGGNPTRSGVVYKVSRVWVSPTCGQLTLDFAGVNNGSKDWNKADFWGHDPARFRKITPGAQIEGIEVERRLPVREDA
jgi:hypothetical protein